MPTAGFLGWGHVSGSTVSLANGTAQSMPFYTAYRTLSGSDKFTFDYTSNNLYLTGNLDVSGTINSYKFKTIVQENTTYQGTTTFGNDTADAHQFTGSVEISGATNALLIENGRVGIGTLSPSNQLEIEGSSGDLIFEIDNNASNSANFQIQNGAGNARVDFVMNDGSANTTITMKGQKVGIGDTTPSYTLDVGGNAQVTTDLFVGAKVGIATTAPEHALSVTGALGVSGQITGSSGAYVAGPVGIGAEPAGSIPLFISGSTSAITTQGGAVVFNEGGGDNGDFRIESDTSTHQLFLDASTGKIGMGVSDPDSLLEILGTSTQLKLSNNADDYASFAVGTHGGLTIATVDAAATAADLTLDVDGDIELNADGGNVNIKDGSWTHFAFDCDNTRFAIYDDATQTDSVKIEVGANGATTIETTDTAGAAANLTMTVDGDIILGPAGGDVLPDADNSRNFGSASKRWANVFTCDLHLKNDRGDWTIIEEEDYLCVVNNKLGKRYKMMLQEIED